MWFRIHLTLLLLFPVATSPQEDIDRVLPALVRITCARGDTTSRGSGFVIGRDGDRATIVTAAHVIEGTQQINVSFAVDPEPRFIGGAILGMDAGNRNGLAVFQVRGALPTGLTSLSFETDRRPRRGDELFLVGFPEMVSTPLTSRRALSGQDGVVLLIDQAVGEGFSGGPVLQDGKVVGVATLTDGQVTYAVNALVVREALKGWGVSLQSSLVPLPSSQSVTSDSSPLTLRQGSPQRFARSGVTLSVTFSDKLGGLATLRILSEGQPPIVEAVLRPGGQIPFRSRLGEHRLSVLDWSLQEKTLELSIAPGI